MTRLIDADVLLEAMRKEDVLKVYECIQLVNNAPTVQREEHDKHTGRVTQHYGFVSDNKDTVRLNWLQLHFDSALTRENIDKAMLKAAPTDTE